VPATAAALGVRKFAPVKDARFASVMLSDFSYLLAQ
jgi:hypothetical protein